MTKTFGFDQDGELVPVEPGGFACNASLPDLHFEVSRLTLDHLEQMNETMNKVMGVPSTLLMNPGMFNEVRNWPWDRAGQGLDQTILQQQRVMNGIHNSILDSIRIVADKYCPLTVRRQFRFPRSKKKRIQKKWRKDPRNWRDENVAFFIRTPKGTPHDDQIDAAMLCNFQTKNVRDSK